MMGVDTLQSQGAEYDLRADGGMPAAPSQAAGGGSIGAEVSKDVSEGHADCTRSTDGPTEPGTSPATSPPRTAREFERAMCALGYSRRQARHIAARGFKSLSVDDLDEDASEELVLLLKQALSQLTERTDCERT